MIKSRRHVFVKSKKIIHKYNAFTFKGPNLFPGHLEKTKCLIDYFPLINIAETPMEAFPMLVIYLFNQDVLDFFIMC